MVVVGIVCLISLLSVIARLEFSSIAALAGFWWHDDIACDQSRSHHPESSLCSHHYIQLAPANPLKYSYDVKSGVAEVDASSKHQLRHRQRPATIPLLSHSEAGGRIEQSSQFYPPCAPKQCATLGLCVWAAIGASAPAQRRRRKSKSSFAVPKGNQWLQEHEPESRSASFRWSATLLPFPRMAVALHGARAPAE